MEGFYSFCAQVRFMVLQITCCTVAWTPQAPIHELLNVISYNLYMKSQGKTLQYEEIELNPYAFEYYTLSPLFKSRSRISQKDKYFSKQVV